MKILEIKIETLYQNKIQPQLYIETITKKVIIF